MQKNVSPERLINILLTMVDDVIGMADCYKHFPAIIDEEFSTIQEGNYGNLDKIVAEKVVLSETIEQHFDSLNHQAKLLLIYHLEFFQGTDVNVRDLSHCSQMFADFESLIKGRNVVVEQTFAFNFKKFKEAIVRFQEIAQQIKPKLELNRVVVTEVAHNYQESNRFWRELNEEKNAPYNQSGTQKSGGKNSAIIAKA